MKCRIQLPDNSFKDFSSCPSALDLAKSISENLAKNAVGVFINKGFKIQDIRSVLQDGDRAKIVTIPSEEALEVIRHSAAHVLAQAVQNLWKEAKVTIGPVIENGFFYDFDMKTSFTQEDLQKIEIEMRSILNKKHKLEKEVWTKEKASQYFGDKGELLKKELIEELEETELSIYRQGPWLDLCRGPHVQHLGQIGAIKLLSHSGAYWRGDPNNKQLQRIYGTAFHTQKALKVFLKKREEAKDNDHRKIGKQQNLFWFSDSSPGSPFFTEKGTAIYCRIQEFLREKYKEYNYQEVITPQVFKAEVFNRSGHTAHYLENMFPVLEKSTNLKKTSGIVKELSFLKPMNCPGHCLLYKKDRWSYKDLPWRIADFGRVHRREPTGAIQGLARVKSFCQDDAHIFCRLDQLFEEIQTGIKMLQNIYTTLGLTSYKIELATRPENRMGTDELWDKAEEALEHSLKTLQLPYKLHPGEGAFYGPKLDIYVKDTFERFWQLGTFQCDFNLPRVFELSYINKKDKPEHPVMVHRAIVGSLERFISVYLEHSKGRLPVWLTPIQVMILPITEQEQNFSIKIQKTLEQQKIICKIDDRNEKLAYKIRESQNQQIPYMLIIGKKEVQSESVSVRLRTGELFSQIDCREFSEQLLSEIQTRSLTSVFLKNH